MKCKCGCEFTLKEGTLNPHVSGFDNPVKIYCECGIELKIGDIVYHKTNSLTSMIITHIYPDGLISCNWIDRIGQPQHAQYNLRELIMSL